MQKLLKVGLAVILVIIFLMPAGLPAYAQDPPGAPTNFVLELGDGGIEGSWAKGGSANTTIIRRGEAGYPETITDGTEVYDGTGISFTDSDPQMGIDNRFYYSAWSYNSGVYSDGYATAKIGGGSMLFIALMVLALGITVFASRQKFILLSMAAALGWLVLGILLLTSPSTINMGGIDETWVQTLGFVFLLMTVVPLLFQMRTDIRHEAQVRGKLGYPGSETESYTTWGPRKGKKQLTTIERQAEYREQLRGKLKRR